MLILAGAEARRATGRAEMVHRLTYVSQISMVPLSQNVSKGYT